MASTALPRVPRPRSPWAIFWPTVIRRTVLLAATVGGYGAMERLAQLAA